MLKYFAPALVALTLAVGTPAVANDNIRFADNRISAELDVDGHHLQFSVFICAQAIGLNAANVDVSVRAVSANDYSV